MAITVSVQPGSGQIIYAWVWLWVCFSKEGPDHIVQNCPRSNLDGLVRFWPNVSCLQASQCARIISPSSGRTQLAHYQFPTFTQLRSSTDSPDHIVQNPAWLHISSGWLCQVLAKQMQSRSKPVCKNHLAHLWPISGPCFQIWHAYWVLI